MIKMILYEMFVNCATYLGQGWLRGPGLGGQIARGFIVWRTVQLCLHMHRLVQLWLVRRWL